MKKLLLPLALLFSIPFNTSCIKEITFDVVVIGENCSWVDPPQKATMGHTYMIKLTPNDGYYLGIIEGCISIETANAGDITYLLSDDCYNQETDILTILGDYVSSKMTIHAIAQLDELHEQK